MKKCWLYTKLKLYPVINSPHCTLHFNNINQNLSSMGFFKKLFSSKKEETSATNETNFSEIYSKEGFDQRFELQPPDEEMVDGCIKMIDSYFIENKIERKVANPINHPQNLDQLDREGFGFVMFCKAYGLPEPQATLFLALALSDFLAKKYGFQLYKDNQPEFPLRGMTLKYDKQGAVLSIYPFEYASKVLAGNDSFEDLHQKIDAALGSMPSGDEVVKNMLGQKGDPS